MDWRKLRGFPEGEFTRVIERDTVMEKRILEPRENEGSIKITRYPVRPPQALINKMPPFPLFFFSFVFNSE